MLSNWKPLSFDHTLTVGIISGLNQDIFSGAGVKIGGGIKTDAAINPVVVLCLAQRGI